MTLRAIKFSLLVPVLAASTLFAESTDCAAPVIIVPDGRVTQSTFVSTATYWYGIYAQAGHSYSVEFVPAADNMASYTKVQISPISIFGPNDTVAGCRGTSTVAVAQNSGFAPTILKNGNGAGRRISFIAQSAGLYLMSASNVSSTGAYSFRAVDTTLFNLRWSTWGNYSDQWSFMNVSDMAILGNLSIYDGSYRLLAAVQISIPPGAQAFRFSGPTDLNLPSNTGGYAIFSHNGPPNAIIADSYMISPNGLVVTYTKFQSPTGQ